MLRSAERNGFVREGVPRSSAWVMGEFLDEVLLGLLAQEWKPDSKSQGAARRSSAAGPPHHTRTTPPGANAGLVAFGGIFSRGSAMSVTLGPTRAARGARRVRSKP